MLCLEIVLRSFSTVLISNSFNFFIPSLTDSFYSKKIIIIVNFYYNIICHVGTSLYQEAPGQRPTPSRERAAEDENARTAGSSKSSG